MDGVTLRDFYAAERTLLAWIRTAIAMMGFGFVVARFGVFLNELRLMQQPGALHAPGLSVWFGTALVFLGVAISLIATYEYRREMRELNRGVAIARRPSWLALATSFGLAALGIAMAAYLLAISGLL